MTSLILRRWNLANSVGIAGKRFAGLRRPEKYTLAYSTETCTWQATSGRKASLICGRDAKKCRDSAGTNIATLARSTEIAEEDVGVELCGNMETSMRLTPIVP